jgi:hypothetical protein
MPGSAQSEGWPQIIERLWRSTGDDKSLVIESRSGAVHVVTEGPIVLHPDAVEFIDEHGAHATLDYAALAKVSVGPAS